MKSQNWRRLVCGVLAVQLCCAPAAEAVSLTSQELRSDGARLRPWTAESDWRKGMPRLHLTYSKAAEDDPIIKVGDSQTGPEALDPGGRVEASADEAAAAPSPETPKESELPESGGVASTAPPEQLPSGSDAGGTETPQGPTEGTPPDGGGAETPPAGEDETISDGESPGETPSDPAQVPMEDGLEDGEGESDEELLTDEDLKKEFSLRAAPSVPRAMAVGIPGYERKGQNGFRNGYSAEGIESGDDIVRTGNVTRLYPKGARPPAYSVASPIDLSKVELTPRLPNWEFDKWAVRHVVGYPASQMGAYATAINSAGSNGTFPTGFSLVQSASDGSPEYVFDGDVLNWQESGKLEEIVTAIKGQSYVETNDYYAVYFSGVWKLSTNATLVDHVDGTKGLVASVVNGERKTSLPLYEIGTVNGAGDPTAASTLTGDLLTTEFSSDQETYFVRVAPDTTEITFDMITFEPGTGSGDVYAGEPKPTVEVHVGRTFGATTTTVTVEGGPDEATAPTDENGVVSHNSETNPARGKWTATVPLEMADGEGKLCNKVEITVIPPAGETASKTYTVYVQRLNEPSLSYKPGNTPAGMVSSMSKWTDAQKEESLAAFQAGGQAWKNVEPKQRPSSTDVPRYDGIYNPAAWSETTGNLDLEEKALVVYQDSRLELPAVTLTDALGKTVTSGVDLTRTLSLKMADHLTTDLIINGGGETCYYTDAGGTARLETSVASDTISLGTTETLDLRGMKIIPGVYSLEYSYTEPVIEPGGTERNYSSNEATFITPEGKAQAKTFCRPLVVLPLPGDVDMDGAVTSADALELRKLLNTLGGNASTDVARLFWNRVCDVTQDGEVNADDLERLYEGGGFQTSYPSEQFYNALPGEIEKDRKDMPPAVTTPNAGKANLKLVYMGKAEGSNIPTEGIDTSGELPEKDQLSVEDVFWLGVKLENASALQDLGSVKAMTVTITIDPDYLGSGSDTVGLDAFRDANTAYWGDSADFRLLWDKRGIFPSEEKAKPSIGDEAGLLEMRLSIYCPDGITMQDGYVAKVPFQLNTYPRGGNGTLAELALGMRELSLAADVTYAYSCQDEMFGGVTKNLADVMDYGGSATLPIGKDTTPATKLRDAVYGDAYSVTTTITANMTEEEKKNLPKGIEYQGRGVFAGTPEEVGLFEFYVGESRYSIQVAKAPLTLTVAPQERYYGEADPEITFTYDKAQLKFLKAGETAESLSGTMEELKERLGSDYTAPTGRYVKSLDASAEAVTTDTDANGDGESYYVVISGASATNYEISYSTATGTNSERGWTDYKVHKRPILVDAILSSEEKPVAQIFASDALQVTGLTGKYTSEKGKDFTVKNPGENGMFEGLPLADTAPIHINSAGVSDKLDITYSALFEWDKDNKFEMDAPVETRTVTIQNLQLSEGENDNRNYRLVNQVSGKDGMVPVTPTAIGRVVGEYATSLDLLRVMGDGQDGPDVWLSYGQGDIVDLSGVLVQINRNTDGEDTEPLAVLYNNFSEYGISLFWAKMDAQGKPVAPFVDAVNNQYADRSKMDGRYLWAKATSYEIAEDGTVTEKDLYDHSYNPVSVHRKVITLTVGAVERYYGEPNLEAAKIPVTYSVADLSQADQTEGRTGQDAWTELADLPGFVAPEVNWVTAVADGSPVGQGAAANKSRYYVTLSGAQSTNYEFRYTQTGYTGDPRVDDALGYNTFKIYPRPVVVAKVTAEIPGIYADATTTILTDQRASTQAGTVTLAKPETGTYYRQTGTMHDDGFHNTESTAVSLPLTGTALYGSDQLSFSFTADYTRDHETPPYFTLTKEKEERTVEIEDVVFSGSGAGSSNYTLIFTCNANAMYGYPGTGSAPDATAYETTGMVSSREATAIRIEVKPQLSYSHGENLDLYGNDGSAALKVAIDYKDSDSKSVTYAGSNFANAGIHLTWDKPWTKDGSNEEVCAGVTTTVTYANENERKLYVTLEQLGDLPPLSTAEPLTITVAKRSLTLTVESQNRYYGEANNTYSFSFNTSTIPIVDRGTLSGTVSGAAAFAALAAINQAYEKTTKYVAPVFTTTATANSPVGGGTEEGGAYLLSLGGGVLANYDITYVSGTIRIFKRPIYLNAVTAEKAATLAHESRETIVSVQSLSQATAAESEANLSLQVPAQTYINSDDPDYVSALGTSVALPLSGTALVSGDTLTIRYQATFPALADRPTIPEADSGTTCNVTISGVELSSDSAKNYMLVYATEAAKAAKAPTNATASGWLSKRKMTGISLQREPNMTYTYGEGFSADKLNTTYFQVTYDDNAVPASVSYGSLETTPQVYYWDPSWPVPKTQAEIQQMVTERADYLATDGDHLVIAPRDGFSHQGKRLLFLIKENGSADAKYLPPVVTTNAVTITPLALQYTISVNDKVYDGTTAGTGSLTLTNLYPGDAVSVSDSLTFTFTSANVAYDKTPTKDHYKDVNIVKQTMRVTGIGIQGDDSANYSINTTIEPTDQAHDGRPGGQSAYITKATRSAPSLESILLSVDMHTNVVSVQTTGTVARDPADRDSDFHLEYALEYLDADGSLVRTDWQDGVWFGGEKLVGPDGSTAQSGDSGFGSRPALPRDTWFRCVVQVAESWNYEVSTGVAFSAEGDLATLIEEAKRELEPEPPATEEPGEGEGDPEPALPEEPSTAPVERPVAALTKTYRYRVAIYAIEKESTTQEPAPKLDAVWFNDTERYEDKDALDLAVDNQEEAQGYFDYYWDARKDNELRFPVSMTEPIYVNIRQDDGTQQVQVNANGSVAIYATKERKSGGGAPLVSEVIISPREVIASLGDEPMQLTVRWEPDYASADLEWSSSDPTVVQVDRTGLLTFVGEGEAIITVIDRNSGARDRIRVTVNPGEKAIPIMVGVMNINALNAFMELDEDMKFHPQWRMTRGDVAIALAKLIGTPEGEEPGEAIRFDDVTGDDPWAEAVELLSRWGVIKGTEDGNFHGEWYATRAEVVVMLSRMLRLGEEPEAVPQFIDGSVEDTWAYSYLNPLQRAGIVEGTGDNYFSPGRDVTRAEVAVFVTRVLITNVDKEGKGLRIPNDVTEEHWAYENILRAVNEGMPQTETETEA